MVNPVSSFILLLVIVGFAQGQNVKTATGYLCASDMGMHAGTIYLRVGTQVLGVTHLFSAPASMQRELRGSFTRYINRPDWNTIGTQLIVRYRVVKGQKEAISITGTGRAQKTQPCQIKPETNESIDLTPILILEIGRNVKLELILVNSGSFIMGGNRNDDEMPMHRVNILTPFYLGKYEVTQAQWKAVMGTKKSFAISDKACGGDCPVDNVDWYEAQEFIKRLNARRDGHKYRLPSEAEWEYAARAGTTGDYAGQLDEMAWYGANSGGKVHPVGQKKPNAWGLYDMHGNVYEWVQDKWHDNYVGAPTDGTAWISGSNNNRPLRGGSWFDNGMGNQWRVAFRNDLGSLRNMPGSFGFRLVVEAR
jgi:formylglycine-generating enzyme required for sulfatase activity